MSIGRARVYACRRVASPPLFFCRWDLGPIRGGVRVEFGGGDEVGTDGVLVDVGAAGFKMFAVEDEVVGEAALPDGKLRADAT